MKTGGYYQIGICQEKVSYMVETPAEASRSSGWMGKNKVMELSEYCREDDSAKMEHHIKQSYLLLSFVI